MARREQSPEQREAELEAAVIDELARLGPPDPVPFELHDGRTVELRPAVGAQFHDFAAAVSPIRKAAAKAAGGVDENADEDFLDLLNEHQPQVYAVIRICSGLAPEAIEALPPGDLLWLWQIGMRLNRDFFSRSTLAASVRNRRALEKLYGTQQTQDPAGSNSPTTSSPTATATGS